MKTAALLVAGLAAAAAATSLALGSLDEPAAAPGGAAAPAAALQVDKSGFRKAPELAGIAGYVNADEGSLAGSLEGKVVLYDIWTYSCVNCIRTLPHITAWDEKYSGSGLVVVGIHSPEFAFEKDIDNVRFAVEKYGIEYPVVLDNDKETWKAFENRYWPRKYVADHEGYIRYDHIGEGAYDETEKVIRALLAERAAAMALPEAAAEAVPDGLVDIGEFEHTRQRTPELYLGYAFAHGRNNLGSPEGFVPGADVEYAGVPGGSEAPGLFYMEGTWSNGRDGMALVSESGSVTVRYAAKEVNIVAGNEAELRVTLDGEPLPAEHAGRDAAGGIVEVDGHDLYNVVSSAEPGEHLLRLEAGAGGLELFTFTFG